MHRMVIAELPTCYLHKVLELDGTGSLPLVTSPAHLFLKRDLVLSRRFLDRLSVKPAHFECSCY